MGSRLGTVAEILAMGASAVTIAFATAQLMDMPGTIEVELRLGYEVNPIRARELLAPFNIV